MYIIQQGRKGGRERGAEGGREGGVEGGKDGGIIYFNNNNTHIAAIAPLQLTTHPR